MVNLVLINFDFVQNLEREEEEDSKINEKHF